MPPTDLIVDCLATYRLARLVTKDKLTAVPRLRTQRWLRAHGHSLAADGLECPWCTSVWFAFAIRFVPRWVRRALAVAAVAGLIAETLDTIDAVGDAAA